MRARSFLLVVGLRDSDVVVVELALLLVVMTLLEVSEMERFAMHAVSRESWLIKS
jgi:hypothetical protein